MKKNLVLRIGMTCLVLTIITSCLVSATYAKYTTEIAGSDSASVAKFEVSANDSTNGSFTFNLFDTITEEDGVTAEADVDTGLIAPGTGGKFELVLSNNSEVSVNYSIVYTLDNSNLIPIQFSNDGTTYSSDLTAVEETEIPVGQKTITVYWKWPYDVSETVDVSDTEISNEAATLQVTAAVNFTQVN